MTPHVRIRVDVFIFFGRVSRGEVNNREVIRLPRVANGAAAERCNGRRRRSGVTGGGGGGTTTTAGAERDRSSAAAAAWKGSLAVAASGDDRYGERCNGRTGRLVRLRPITLASSHARSFDDSLRRPVPRRRLRLLYYYYRFIPNQFTPPPPLDDDRIVRVVLFRHTHAV